MAKCEQGYLCDVCGRDVENIWDSDLYLRYVIGQVDPETLHTTRERHIRCNPTLAQFIVDPGFQPVIVTGSFDKRQLDAAYVAVAKSLGLPTQSYMALSDGPILDAQAGFRRPGYLVPAARHLVARPPNVRFVPPRAVSVPPGGTPRALAPPWGRSRPPCVGSVSPGGTP